MAALHSEKYTASTIEDRGRMTKSLLYAKDILSIKDLSLDQVQQVLTFAATLKANPQHNLLNHQIIAHCFFEPSTRTRLSFEAATLRLGGQVIGFGSGESLSVQKGETLHDTMLIISKYADLIILRHPKEGAARLAANVCDIPVINAGDGANQHPTQTLIDLFSIQVSQSKLQGLSVAVVGDLKYGRSIHSFTQACKFFDIRLFFVAPDALTLPEFMCDKLKKDGVRFSFHQSLEEVIPKVDILYMSRIQQERFNKLEQFENRMILTPALLEKAKSNLKILHPLPRVNEIDIAVDQSPHAYYFQQAANGMFVRQALLTLILNQEINA